MKRAPDPTLTIQGLVEAIQGSAKPHDRKVFPRVLELIVPALGAKLDVAIDAAPTEPVATAAGFMAYVPAQALLECLDDDDKWAPWLVEAVPDLGTIKSYRDDYRRCFNRVLEHAMARCLITAAARGVAPAWHEARNAIKAVVPVSKTRLQAMLTAGVTEVHGFSLNQRGSTATWRRFSLKLTYFNKMARFMTSRGILHPREVRPKHIYGDKDSLYEAFKAENADAMIGYYHARNAWLILKQLEPGWKLADFPTPLADKQYGMPLEHPALKLIQEGLEAYERKKVLARSTKENTLRDLSCLLGFLQKYQGFDVAAFCKRFDLAEELFFVLLAGFPPIEDGPEPEPADELRRLAEDEDYLEEIVTMIRRANKLHAFKKGDCRRNPFVTLYAEWHIQRGTAAMAERALKMFRMLGDHYLGVHKSQREWLSGLRTRVIDAKKAQPPSERATRKQLAATDDELWDKLVAAWPRLTAHTEERRQDWLAAEAEDSGSSKAERALKSWAVALRNELMFGMLLCFTLRKENLQGLRLEAAEKRPKSVYPESYTILLPPLDTKATDWIRRVFPEKGPFARLRELLDHYLAEARSVLLGERGETPYLFVSHAGADQSARDEQGDHRVGRERLPAIVRNICKEFFGDILPRDMDLFNVHLVRDMFSQHAGNYAGGTGITAQGLANTPGTVDRHYRLTDRQGDRKVRRHLESLPGKKVPCGGKKGRAGADGLRADIRQMLGPDVDERKIDALVKAAQRRLRSS